MYVHYMLLNYMLCRYMYMYMYVHIHVHVVRNGVPFKLHYYKNYLVNKCECCGLYAGFHLGDGSPPSISLGAHSPSLELLDNTLNKDLAL